MVVENKKKKSLLCSSYKLEPSELSKCFRMPLEKRAEFLKSRKEESPLVTKGPCLDLQEEIRNTRKALKGLIKKRKEMERSGSCPKPPKVS